MSRRCCTGGSREPGSRQLPVELLELSPGGENLREGVSCPGWDRGGALSQPNAVSPSECFLLTSPRLTLPC